MLAVDGALADVAEKLIDGGALVDFTSPKVFSPTARRASSNTSRIEARRSFAVVDKRGCPLTPLHRDLAGEKRPDRNSSICSYSIRPTPI